MKFLVIAIMVLFAGAAQADPAKVDMTMILKENDQPLKDPTGRAESDKDCTKCADLTLRRALAIALNRSEPNLTIEQLFARGALIKRIKDNEEATLSAEDVTLIEHCLPGVGFFPSVVVQIVMAIDPNFKASK